MFVVVECIIHFILFKLLAHKQKCICWEDVVKPRINLKAKSKLSYFFQTFQNIHIFFDLQLLAFQCLYINAAFRN